MGNPICHANSSVTPQQLQATQLDANQRFTEVRPILDSELLTDRQLRARERALCRATGICGMPHWQTRRYRMDDYARQINDALTPPIGFDHRMYVNMDRLLHSRRFTTAQIISLLRLLPTQDRSHITEFRQLAQSMLLSAHLFYYDYIPNQGAIACFMER